MDPWVKIRVRIRWLLSAIHATKEQAIRDHSAASQLPPDHPHRSVKHAEADMHWEASEGFKASLREFEDDCKESNE